MKKLLIAPLLGPLLGLAACAQASAAPPPPARVDVPASTGLQTAIFAGGCFWGMEGVFEHVKGVRSVVSGYAGGKAGDANYEQVSSETTGHAEAVKISYDPKQISYGQLLRIFFAEHDPTSLNRQGPDQGTSYRSAIFPRDAAQRKAAAAYIAQLSASRAFPRPIVTHIESGGFYPAEAYHQDFLRRNPHHPYIMMWDMPKLGELRKQFPNFWRG
jgi:peptide-methionine (S)-S-oxide reductase